MCALRNSMSLNLKTSQSGENSQSSHQKSPKSPYGGISPNLLNETCRASNSVWKIGITSFIRMTQSKVGPFQKSQNSSKKPCFCGYFGYFLQNSLFLNSMMYHFGEPTGWVKNSPTRFFWQFFFCKILKKRCETKEDEMISWSVLMQNTFS